jgi:protein required for attachment to host cells
MTHDAAERERRFAGAVLERLQENVTKHKIGHLAIFALPRMLGPRGKVPSQLLAGHFLERAGNLMRQRGGQPA